MHIHVCACMRVCVCACMFVCVCGRVLSLSHCVCGEWFTSPTADEGVYINSGGGRIKDVRLQWGEVPSSIGTCI